MDKSHRKTLNYALDILRLFIIQLKNNILLVLLLMLPMIAFLIIKHYTQSVLIYIIKDIAFAILTGVLASLIVQSINDYRESKSILIKIQHNIRLLTNSMNSNFTATDDKLREIREIREFNTIIIDMIDYVKRHYELIGNHSDSMEKNILNLLFKLHQETSISKHYTDHEHEYIINKVYDTIDMFMGHGNSGNIQLYNNIMTILQFNLDRFYIINKDNKILKELHLREYADTLKFIDEVSHRCKSEMENRNEYFRYHTKIAGLIQTYIEDNGLIITEISRIDEDKLKQYTEYTNHYPSNIGHFISKNIYI